MTEDWQKSPRALALHLVERGSQYDIETLEQIYAPSQYLLILSPEGTVEKIGREQNMQMFRDLRQSQAAPLSPEAEILHIEEIGADGVVLIRRKMGTSEPSRLFELRMRKVGDAWQVTGETVAPWIKPEQTCEPPRLSR